MDGRLPVASVIHTPDVEVVAITLSQGWAGSVLTSRPYVLSLVRNSGVVTVPQDRVAIKATGVIGGIHPPDINRVITGPGT